MEEEINIIDKNVEKINKNQEDEQQQEEQEDQQQQNQNNIPNNNNRKKHSCRFKVIKENKLYEKFFRTHLDIIITEDEDYVRNELDDEFMFSQLNYHKKIHSVLTNIKKNYVSVVLDSLVVKKLPYKILIQRLNNQGTELAKKLATRLYKFNQNFMAMVDRSKPQKNKNNNNFDTQSVTSLDTCETSFNNETNTMNISEQQETLTNSNNQITGMSLTEGNLKQLKEQKPSQTKDEENMFRSLNGSYVNPLDLKAIEQDLVKNRERPVLIQQFECNKEKYELKLRRLYFSKPMYTLLGETCEKFIQFLMRCGFPEIYNTKKYFGWWMQRMDQMAKKFVIQMKTFDGIKFTCTETRKSVMGEENLYTIQYFDDIKFEDHHEKLNSDSMSNELNNKQYEEYMKSKYQKQEELKQQQQQQQQKQEQGKKKRKRKNQQEVICNWNVQRNMEYYTNLKKQEKDILTGGQQLSQQQKQQQLQFFLNSKVNIKDLEIGKININNSKVQNQDITSEHNNIIIHSTQNQQQVNQQGYNNIITGQKKRCSFRETTQEEIMKYFRLNNGQRNDTIIKNQN